jgi:hypothetical protein
MSPVKTAVRMAIRMDATCMLDEYVGAAQFAC